MSLISAQASRMPHVVRGTRASPVHAPLQKLRSHLFFLITRQIGWLIFALFLIAGCTRTHYRIKADRATYRILGEKTAGTPWALPSYFTIFPNPTARFFDPTPFDDPLLPIPSPKLYAYELPEIPKRDPDRFQPEESQEQPSCVADELCGQAETFGVPVGSEDKVFRKDEEKAEKRVAVDASLQLTAFQGQDQQEEKPNAQPSDVPPSQEDLDEERQLRITPIAKDVWQSVPSGCLRRMLEFASVQEEYRRSFGKEPGKNLRDQSPRLALEDIVELALVNSRAYQTQKEILYSAALRLTFERYQFAMRFTPLDNGTIVNYAHTRTGGISESTLGIPTNFNGRKILAYGGDVLARFANNVVLTFNGPEGFAMDIGSEILLDLAQPVFQPDIVFEPLTQAERNVVYASRDFARFRKSFFRDIAFQYYSLINTYRDIEIDAQTYFSNLRAFAQQKAEFQVGKQSRIQVDQIEQDVLSSRSSLIATCNTLASGLDNLKFAMGLPPEIPINLDLTELEQITLRDKATVAAELVRRKRQDLQQERSNEEPDRILLLNDGIEITKRLLDWIELRDQLGQEDGDRSALQDKLAQMLVEEAELAVEYNRRVLAEKKKAVPPSPPELILGRTTALIKSLQDLIRHQLNLATRQKVDPAEITDARMRLSNINKPREKLRQDLDQAVKDLALDRIPGFVKKAETLLAKAEKLATDAAQLLRQSPLTEKQRQQKTRADVDYLLSESGKLLTEESIGLVPIELDMDDGMLTALVSRFDLMNQRGILADEWRRIKLAGDDLKSILNLNAAHVIRTEKDRPFGFTWDESETRLTLAFDAPLNRIAQRNAFRLSLINYQAALRNLIELQDGIKIEVRDDLRALQLDREQYRIAVASAALASERVTSTRLQLQEGIEGVSARDFLEAQRAYTASVSNVASQHIGYIQDRISLFLDLELLVVDDSGFWPKLYNEDYQPLLRYELPLVPPYGTLPRHIWYSHKVKRMLKVPPGQTLIFQSEQNTPSNRDEATIGMPTAPETLPRPKE